MTSIRPDRSDDRPIAAETPPRLAHREKGEKLTVFLFPGLSGIVDELNALLSPSEAPLHFVLICYRHWSALGREPDELDRLVDDCVSQIESHGPPGTILLVGYSFGGHMAWAVARAMAARGHRTGLLGLIDVPARPNIEASARSTLGRWGRLVRGIRRGETGHQLARSSAGILFRSRSWARAMFRRLHGFGFLPRIFNCIDANLQIRYHHILLAECIARVSGIGERAHIPSVLFRCSERPLGEDSDLGWTRYLANLRVVTLSGNHASVLEIQNVKQITAQLTATISEGEGYLPSLTSHLYVNDTGCLLSEDHVNCRRIG